MKFSNKLLALILTLGVMIPAAIAAEKIVNTTSIQDQASPDRAVFSQSVDFQPGGSGISVRKEVEKSTVQIGEPVGFTISVINNNPTISASNVVLEDLFDELFFTLDTQTIAPSPECYGDASRIKCTFATIAPSSQKTLTYRLVPKKAGASANVVTVTDAFGKTVNDNALILITDPLAPFTIRKTPDKSNISIGEEVNYAIEVKNTSPDQTLSNVSFVDDFPEDRLQIQTVPPLAGITCQNDASTVSCQIGTLAPGQSKTVNTRFRSLIAGTATNTVTVKDSKSRVAVTSAKVIVVDPKNPFQITKTANKSVFAIDEEAIFTATISNRDNSKTLTNVTLIDDFPENQMQILSASGNGMTCQNDNSKISCTIPSMVFGAEYTLTARYRVIKTGIATNMIIATSGAGETGAKSASVTILEQGNPIRITKTANKGVIILGDTVEYTVVVENVGQQQDLQNVSVLDVYPEQFLTFQNVVPGNGITCNKDGGRIACQIANFRSGGAYSFTTRYLSIASGAASNKVTATDANGRSNSATADIIVLDPQTPFVVSKEPDKPNVDVGDDVTFTVTISARENINNVQFVSIVDDFSEEFLQIKNVTTSPGITCVRDAHEIRCVIANPTVGGVFTIASRYTTLKPGTATNTVTLTDQLKKILGTTTANVIILDPGNPFLITKRPNKEVADVGEEVEYTVVMTNRTHNKVLKNVAIVDNYAQDLLEMRNVTTSGGLTCQSDSTEIRCHLEDFGPGTTYSFTARYQTLAPGTAVNTVKITEENGSTNEAAANVVILDPGAPFLVIKTPSKSKIETGEQIHYAIRITNRTPAQTLKNVTIVDDFPEDLLEIQSLVASDGLTCTHDHAEIRCHIDEFFPGMTYLLNSDFEAKKPGAATNTVTVSEPSGKTGTSSTSVEITEPEIIELQLSSDCEGRTVLVGQQCVLTVIARYRYIDEKNISKEAVFYNFENIGTMGGNILTTTKDGKSTITASFQNVTSDPITIEVVKELAVATSPDGGIITHFPARTSGGLPDTSFYGDVIQVGQEAAGPGAVGKSSRLILSALGGAKGFSWILEDKSFGSLADFKTGTSCPVNGMSASCVNTDSVIFEAGSAVGTVLLRLSDAEGRKRTFTIHILQPAVKSVEVGDSEGNPLVGPVEYPRNKTIAFTAKETYFGGAVKTDVESSLNWEYKYNGGDWVQVSDAGTISGGILTPLKNGTFVIRAKRAQVVGMPGVDVLGGANEQVTSSEITVEIGAPVPYVDSIRTAGNLAMGEGTTETLYLRLRHFGTVGDIGDIELNLIKGRFLDPESISTDVQHFKIELVPTKILAENSGKNTVLLQIPFFIPILDDLRDGPHTIRVIVNNQNGLAGKNILTGLLPVYLGVPLKGDANLDGKIDLTDAVTTARFLSGTMAPDALQMLAMDADRSGLIAYRDFLEIFRDLLRLFLT